MMSLKRRKTLLYWSSLSRSIRVNVKARHRFLLLGFLSGIVSLFIDPGFSRDFFILAAFFGFVFWFFSLVLSRFS